MATEGSAAPEEGDYPRPQMVRDQWTDLNGPWDFAYDDEDRGEDEGWYRPGHEAFTQRICVPFPPESSASGVHDPGFHEVLWYRRNVSVPGDLGPDRLMVHFGAVDYAATVWANGQLVGSHEGGHTPFSCDVTGPAKAGRDLVVVVRAQDAPQDLTQPRGKQSWAEEPHAIWYGRTSGIWQSVWFEVVPGTHIVSTHWQPDLRHARVGFDIALSRTPKGLVTARVRLSQSGRLLAEHSSRLYEPHSHLDIALSAVPGLREMEDLLWSPGSPNLVDAEVCLVDDDGADIDRVRCYFGLRSVEVADGKFILNGSPFYLRLALEQGFWRESHLAAPSSGALRTEVELIKELGFNGVRLHQKIEDPRFLYWADRLGIVVWSEMPSAYVYSSRVVERVTKEWLEVLERDRSHPSIVAWVPLNESWGVDDIEAREDEANFALSLYHLTKAVDPARPVVSNDGWEHVKSDIWTIHDYSPTGAGLRERYGDREQLVQSLSGRRWLRRVLLPRFDEERGQPVVLSEFGGLSYAPSGGEEWFGYATVASPTEFAGQLKDLVDAICENDQISGFCYTQLTDTGQERNGLLDENRHPKLPVAELREIFSRVSKAVPHEELEISRRIIRDGTQSKGGLQ
jgi:beta-galactosidase/beta-glucuronidase